MYIGKSYKLSEFIIWTRKGIYQLLLLGIVPVLLYQLLGLKWVGISWTMVGLLGTATAFIVAFRNTQTYNRTLEGQQIWTGILSMSRSWGMMSRDFASDPAISKKLVYIHLAWLTSLRYQMREYRVWEVSQQKHNREYQRHFSVAESDTTLEVELLRYLSERELADIMGSHDKATQLLSLQSKMLKKLYDDQHIVVLQFVDMQRLLKELLALQGRSQHLKDFPYPRQYAIINNLLIKLFCFLLPYGMLNEFDKLNESIEGAMKGNMVWLVVPFSLLISWMYTALNQVGESTENPFEGSANDIPINQISRTVEIDLKEMIGDDQLPKTYPPQHDIIL